MLIIRDINNLNYLMQGPFSCVSRYVTMPVKTQLKPEIYCFLSKIALHNVENILLKYKLDIFNTDRIRPC